MAKNKVNYSNTQFAKDLWRYIRPYKWKFFAGVLIRLSSDICRLYPAIAISQIIQILSDGNIYEDYDRLVNIFIIWGIVTIYYSFAHNYCKYLGFQVAENASLGLYKEALAHIFKLDLSWQELENSGNKLKRLDNGQKGVDLSVRRIFNPIIEVSVNTIGIIAIFINLNFFLSIGLIFYVISFFLVGTYLLKRAINQEKVVSKSFEDLSGFTFESLNNIQTVKSLAIDRAVITVVAKQLEGLVSQIKKRIFYYQSQYGILNTYANFFKYFTILFLSLQVVRGTVDISLLVLFMGLFGKVDESTGELTDVVQELAKAKIWMSRAREILNTKPTIENYERTKKQDEYPNDWKVLTVKDVKFYYKKNIALNGVTFDVKRNEKVGIVGLSGAGKSTLFKLLLDLYEDYEGEIKLDRVSLKNIKRQSYIDHISVVLQDTELFDMTLRENIEMASLSKIKNTELLSDVIKMAHLDDVVAGLPNGINTIVGEKGIKLSGGQRQRLGIARALYRQPDILLLDEATSHLDAHSEKEIQKAILENMNKFTTIVIAHRLSTIKAMDKIVVLEKGKVVEQGSFEQLLKKKGTFARMWSDQKI